MPSKKLKPIICPKCFKPMHKNGVAGKNRLSPAQQYIHNKTDRKTCNYQSTVPIGVKARERVGIPERTSKALKKEVHARPSAEVVTYVITSAQNATPVFEAGWKTLLNYVKVNGAKLLVIPYRYKNPTSIWSAAAKSDDWWSTDVLPYIIGERTFINKHLILLGDIMTQPTADRPLAGFETITAGQSGIIGHPKLELMTVATPQQKLPKLLTTTGSITKKNYISSRAGKKGEHHHTFGACVVEVCGDRFYLRQINMKSDGSFCDLLSEYRGDEVKKYDRVPALVMGDTHVEVVDPDVVAATFTGADSMVKQLRPEVLVWHDLHDGTAKNHHERGRAFHDYVKHRAGKDNVREEIERTFAFVDAHTPADTKNVIVPSNHHDFVKEWVENTDPRRDPENVEFWTETFLAVIRSEATTFTPSGVAVQDPFAYWGSKLLASAARTTFLRRDQALQIKGIEVGYHGDKGPGGARGTRANFRNIGVKSIIGHAHSPGIMDGAYQVGTSSRLDLTYAAGSPSGWLHTHCIVLPNGKRQLLNIIEGRWRA